MLGSLVDDALCHMSLDVPLVAPVARPLARKRLGRAFDERSSEKCLLLYQADRLAQPLFAGTVRNLHYLGDRGISFRAVNADAPWDPTLIESATTILYQPGLDDYLQSDMTAVLRLRDRNPDAWLVFCDWFAPCDVRFATTLHDHVDLYTKKTVLADRDGYLREHRAHTNLMGYYGDLFKTPYDLRDWDTPAGILSKLKLTPAFSTGEHLYSTFKDDFRYSEQRTIDLHARIQTNGTPWYSEMRKAAYSAVDGIKGLNVACAGLVDRRAFMKEMASSKLCFSPFGYGEICWRDFEAFSSGAVLIKPDMSHLNVLGDLFRPWDTYIPVDWDYGNLAEVVARALAEPDLLRRIALNAHRAVKDSMGQVAVYDYMMSLLRPGTTTFNS